jgi:hypothetical protein
MYAGPPVADRRLRPHSYGWRARTRFGPPKCNAVTNKSKQLTRDFKDTKSFIDFGLDIPLFVYRVIGVQWPPLTGGEHGSISRGGYSGERPATRSPTDSNRNSYLRVDQLAPEGLSLLFGHKKTRTLLTWRCLEGIPAYLRGRGWEPVAANRHANSDYGLDGYLKGWIKRQTANYVAVVLERAGVVELNGERPAQIRLTDGWYAVDRIDRS